MFIMNEYQMNCFHISIFLWTDFCAHKKTRDFSTIFRNLQNNFHDPGSQGREFSHVCYQLKLYIQCKFPLVIHNYIFTSQQLTNIIVNNIMKNPNTCVNFGIFWFKHIGSKRGSNVYIFIKGAHVNFSPDAIMFPL